MAQAFARSLAHSPFSYFATTKEALSFVSPNSCQASQLKSALCLSAPHLIFVRDYQGRRPSDPFICTFGRRLRQSHHLSAFQIRGQPLPASCASKTRSRLGPKKIARELQNSIEAFSINPVVPAPVETKSPPPAQLGKPSGAASGVAAAVPSALSGPPPGFKRCIECQRAKLLVDFKTSVNSKDGLNDNCRACLGVFRAKRAGRELGHLGLSVEEAWQRAKTCTLCQVSKEIRDYGVDRNSKDGLRYECRSCIEVRQRQRPDRPPVNHPLECDKCSQVKPAIQFAICRKARLGRQTTCILCTRKREAELERIRAPIFIKRERKVCKMCKESKELSVFSRKRLAMDGLYHICKKCVRSQKACSKKEESVEAKGDCRSAGTNPSMN